ncbi:MAG: hypothetical protein QOK42_2467 [Frankiaceae bacterium]|nr:hypothetical protein [Frankiaceae bacterium]
MASVGGLRLTLTSNTLQVGGAERQRVLLANGLAARGHRVTFVVLQAAGPLAADHAPGERLDKARASFGRLPAPADVVITGCTNTEVAYAWTARLRSPGRLRWVAVSHSWPPDEGHLYRGPLRVALRRADALGALTPGHAARLRAADGLVASPHTVPNGTDLRASLRPRPDGPVRVGCVGRLEAVKGVDRLIRAMAELPPGGWSLDVYGDGSERAALERLAAELAVEVTWHGWTSDIPAALSRLDVLVIPSRSEALPMVALEAMASGVAVAAAPVGAMPELLAGTGLLLDADPARWPEQLHTLIQDRVEQDRLATAGHGLVEERWGLETMLDGYESLLSSVVRGENTVGT